MIWLVLIQHHLPNSPSELLGIWLGLHHGPGRDISDLDGWQPLPWLALHYWPRLCVGLRQPYQQTQGSTGGLWQARPLVRDGLAMSEELSLG